MSEGEPAVDARERLIDPRRAKAEAGRGRADCVAQLGDAALIVAITRADRAAFAEAYRRHAGRVGNLARRICGADAEDVVQDVFVSLWQRPERFDATRGSLARFLVVLAHDRAVDMCRNTDARRARETREASVVRVDNHAELEALAHCEADSVRALVGRLPEREREAIQLAYLGGHTYREVAVILREPEGTIKTRIRAGLARMAAWIAESAGDAGSPAASGVGHGSETSFARLNASARA